MADARRIAIWRIVLAAILDFLTAFIVLGFLVGLAFGGASASGFSLQGWTALLLFALVAAYFIVFDRFLGGTIWKRIVGAVR